MIRKMKLTSGRLFRMTYSSKFQVSQGESRCATRLTVWQLMFGKVHSLTDNKFVFSNSYKGINILLLQPDPILH